MKRIPIKAAKQIADLYDYDQVIIIARDCGPKGGEHMTTYGRNKQHCDIAARAGEYLQREILGWEKEIVTSRTESSNRPKS